MMARLRTYIGPNWDSHYEQPFQELLTAERTGAKPAGMWNWAAALTPFWFWYRRLYGAFFLYGALNLFFLLVDTAVDAVARGQGSTSIFMFWIPLAVVQGRRADRLLYRKARKDVASEDRGPQWLAWRGQPLSWVPGVAVGLIIGWKPLLILVLASSAPVNNFQAQDAATAPVDEQPVANTPTVITASDGQSQITIPPHWGALTGLNQYAEIQVGSIRDEEFLIAMTVSKALLPPEVTLEHYVRQAVEEMQQEKVNKNSVYSARYLTIQDQPAIQYVIRGNHSDGDWVFWITCIETPENFHRVLAYARGIPEQAGGHVMLTVIDSFRESDPQLSPGVADTRAPISGSRATEQVGADT
jgi:hypothetical protein